MKRISFIIATKDRPGEVDRLLDNIRKQSVQPHQIIIVDSGSNRVDGVIRKYPGLNTTYLFSSPPSAARQRNEGLKVVESSSDLIGFLDDDITFEDQAIENMLAFWESAAPHIGGAGFNLINHPPLFAGSLKSLPLAERLGFYSRRRGIVLRSGFHTMIGIVNSNTQVEWLPSTAVVWRKFVLTKYQFDEWYNGYSYLEDLDFSYSVSKEFKLIMVADAYYYHHPALGGRTSDFNFGKKEVKNRLHFVNKNSELSTIKCYQTLVLRMAINMFSIFNSNGMRYFNRTLGNIAELLKPVLNR